MKAPSSEKLNSWQVLAIAFGAMVGWSWILLTSTWIDKAGVIGAVAAIFIVGLSIFFIAGIYGELASIFPENGGEHIYTKIILGSHVSFVCSWLLLLGYVSVVAFEIVVFPIVISYLFPSVNQFFLWNFNGFDVYLGQVILGISAGLVLTFVNSKGVACNNVAGSAFSAMKIQAKVTMACANHICTSHNIVEEHWMFERLLGLL